jgi:alkylation response protein AidB-like acyl-CoA dehydrogenase
MKLKLETSYERFRGEVRKFISAELPADMAARNGRGFHSVPEDRRAWTRILAAKGWSCPRWPIEHGGTGWDDIQVMIFEEELFRGHAPLVDQAGINLVGPVIYTFGSEDQKRRFLPPTRSGEIFWGQGFSEPGSGSDLASLSTRADRVSDGGGDYLLVNGRKIWTTDVHYSDYIFVLVRTDPAVKQRGISFIVVDARSAGITIRPIIDIGEGHSLNEVTFDDVRVPVENLIGEVNRGWTYAKFLLDNERAFSAEVPRNKVMLQRLKDIAACERIGSGRLIDDPAFAARLAQLDADLASLEYMSLRALSEKAGGTSLPVGSMLKIRGSELIQKIGEMQIEALGDYGRVVYPETEDGNDPTPGPDYAPGIAADFYYRRACTIYGGANEIQRNIIAKSFLGL